MEAPKLIETIKIYRSTCPECGEIIDIKVTHREGEPNCWSSYTCETCGLSDRTFHGQET